MSTVTTEEYFCDRCGALMEEPGYYWPYDSDQPRLTKFSWEVSEEWSHQGGWDDLCKACCNEAQGFLTMKPHRIMELRKKKEEKT